MNLKDAITSAANHPDEFPDPLVLAIFQNDLRATISNAIEGRFSLKEIDEAIRHVGSRIPVGTVQKFVRKWGKKL
jgi:hypothetical protein